jgi:hypothetical protein
VRERDRKSTDMRNNGLAAGAAKDVKDKYGDIRDEDFYKDLFKDGPPLCGQTCAYLATGRGKELRGFFIGKYPSQSAYIHR